MGCGTSTANVAAGNGPKSPSGGAEMDDVLAVNAALARKEKKSGAKASKSEAAAASSSGDVGVEEEEAHEGQFKATKPWLGAIKDAPDGWAKPAGHDDPPHAQLHLQHVYGVRSRDVHNTVYLVNEKKLVYCTAAVGVVLDTTNNTQKFFMNHDDDIVSLAFHRATGRVATGQTGKNPTIFVWDANTLACVSELRNGHQRGVVAIDISPDGSRVASVGLDDNHTVCVWDAATGAKIATAKGGVENIVEVTWAPDGHTFVTVGPSHFKLWTLNGASLTSNLGVFGDKAKRQMVTSTAFFNGKAITGTIDGSLYTWDANNLVGSRDNVHNGCIYTVRAIGDKLYTGGRDGFVKVFNANLQEVAKYDLNPLKKTNADQNSIKSIDLVGGTLSVCTVTSQIVLIKVATGAMEIVHEAHHGVQKLGDGYGELWGLDFHPADPNVFATACEDSTVRVWDATQRKLLKVFRVASPARSVAWSPNARHLAVGTIDGQVIVLDANTGAAIVTHKTHSNIKAVDEVKFSPDGRFLVSGAHDAKIIFYDANANYKKLAEMTSHKSYITHVDFSKDSQVLQSNCGAEELLFTDVASMRQNPYSSDYKNTQWATYTCVLGWAVQGIWPEFADVTDVNAVDRSHNERVLATGEDSGKVRLFNFPCLGGGLDRRGKLLSRPGSNDYVGHSEHVTKVRFNHNDAMLVSTGGADLSVFQWVVQ